VAVVPEWLEGANITQTTARIAINPSQHEPAFFYHYLGSGMGLRLVHHFEKGGAQPGLNIEDINIFPIVCPPLPEQRRIAQVLGAWDRAIATVQQLLAAQQERKRGLMQELLTGRRRFKGFEGKWKNYRLGELFERITRKNDVGDSHVMTISAQHGLIDQREIFNKSVAGANLAAYYLLKKGEFAYNKSSSNGYPVGAIKRLERYEQGILSVLYICFGLKPGAANGDFMAAYFDAGLMDEGIGAIAQEGARNHGLLNVSTSDFFDIDVHIPQAEEQAVIAKAIGVLNKETESIQNYLDHLTTQKQGLMQQLLTGAVRVKC
jgi:type I restriction enzyme S subunit